MGRESDEGSYIPEIVLLYCNHSVAGNFTLQPESGFRAKLVAMPCSSKVEAYHVLNILSEGADGVVVIACPDGKCRFLVGNLRAEKRVGFVKKLLDEIGVGADRAGIVRGEKLDSDNLAEIARKSAESVMPLGPNPMKGDRE